MGSNAFFEHMHDHGGGCMLPVALRLDVHKRGASLSVDVQIVWVHAHAAFVASTPQYLQGKFCYALMIMSWHTIGNQ